MEQRRRGREGDKLITRCGHVKQVSFVFLLPFHWLELVQLLLRHSGAAEQIAYFPLKMPVEMWWNIYTKQC